MSKPTCEQLIDDELETVHRESADSWRHGCYIAQVFYRETDDTYWRAIYRLSNDGETNELCEGDAEICQVKPVKTSVTTYQPVIK